MIVDGLGCRGDAAEIKPMEPVWVIPAKGAAACRTAPHRNASKAGVAIIGAGVIGLGIAWRLAQRGASGPGLRPRRGGAGASHAAAGMLAACAEAEPGEESLARARPRKPGALARFRRRIASERPGVDVELRRKARCSSP